MPFMKDISSPFFRSKPGGGLVQAASRAVTSKTGGGMWPGLASKLIRPGVGINATLSKRFGIYGDDSVPELLAAPVDMTGVPSLLAAPQTAPDIFPSLTTAFTPTVAAPTTTGASATSEPSLLNRLLTAGVATAKYLTQKPATGSKLPAMKSSNSSTLMLLAGVGLVAILVLSKRRA